MIEFLYQHDAIVAKFCATLIPHCHREFGDNIKTIGVLDEDGRLIAGIIFHNYDPEFGVMEITGAAVSQRWMTRRVIRRIFQYAFDECGVQMVLQRLPADDERQIGMLAAFGYSLIRIPRLFGRDRDGVLASFTDDDWAASRFNKPAAPALEEAA